MVEDRVTDGERIAQLLASEFTGLATGQIDRVSVVDADPGAEPSENGTVAYGVAIDGERGGSVVLYPTRAELALPAPGERSESLDAWQDAEGLDVSVESDGVTVAVHSGAAVKRVVDGLDAFVGEQ